MKELLLSYIKDPESDINNFNLALSYDDQKHHSPAASYYLRCAEKTQNIDLRYESLLRMYLCYKKLGGRDLTCDTVLKQAIALCPSKPEAYFLLTQHYESKSEWTNVYVYACMALENCKKPSKLKTDIGFPDLYALLFQKAAASWWFGKPNQAREIFHYILNNHIQELDDYYKNLLEKNLSNLGSGPESVAIRRYDKSLKNKFRFNFDGLDTIDSNFSQVYQDLFILTCLNGKKNGKYLEIGSSDAFKNSNTALLETKFGWSGIGIEYNPDLANSHKGKRKSLVLCTDALIVDYNKLLNKYFPDQNIIDYLQLDIEPPRNTYEALLSIPFDKYNFAVITYEHDYYVDLTRSYRDKSRDYLEAKGYQLVIPNISPDENSPFEDWWVHPELVSKDIVKKILKQSQPDINPIEKLFLNN